MAPRQPASPPYRVATSPVHGRGLFATRAIPADTLIGTFESRPAKRDGVHTIYLTQQDDTVVRVRVLGDLRFVNHARPSNACFFAEELWSVRRIKAGDEITHDYGETW